MAIDPSDRTLRRRAKELFEAADAEVDDDSRGLLLFYAIECGLKALYMDLHKLARASAANAQAVPARSFGHRIDDLIAALRIPMHRIPSRPPHLQLRGGGSVHVSDLHEAWRYGEKIVVHADAVAWLRQVASFVREELR
ncbi:hypothetical protein [Azospirillum halopraeferens]|uniref:hypothetical protein n=1 Tax=Azospirillum halopraeferens TaxID=34010 RepID=UPI0012EC93F2|nr:hypothetical protein [Azospirillum halopraeferens]